MKIKKTLISIGVVITLALTIVTGFYNGKAYIRYKGSIEANKKDVNTCTTTTSKKRLNYSVYKACDKEFKVQDWTLSEGNKDSKTTILVMHGGPTTKFAGREGMAKFYSQELFDQLKENEIVWLRQPQHMKREFGNIKSITKEVAKKEADEYSKILDKIIEHYKAKKQRVVLLGHSFGSYLANKYLNDFGAKANYTLVFANRLEDIWEFDFKDSNKGQRFDVNNKKIEIDFNRPFYSKPVTKFKWNEYISDFFTGYDGILESLQTSKLKENSNVLWISSELDRNIGSFKEDEKKTANKYGKLLMIKEEDLIRIAKLHGEKTLNKESLQKYAHRSMMSDREIINKWKKIAGL